MTWPSAVRLGYVRSAATTGRYLAMLSLRPTFPCSANIRTVAAAQQRKLVKRADNVL